MSASKFMLAALLAVPGIAAAMTLDDLTVGKTVCGPNTTLAEMKGKIVYVEYWGTR